MSSSRTPPWGSGRPPVALVDSAILTDLYQLTMMQGYWAHRRQDDLAAFELFFRTVPEGGGYCLAAGIDDAVSLVEQLRFTEPQLEYLASLGTFRREFLDFLRALRFTGDLWAVPEGTPVFPNEPILAVSGPLIEAQWLETLLLNCVNFQTLIATKASRIVRSARPAVAIEFGLRRAQGPNGGLWASRAAYVGGCIGTSNVEAGFRYGIPVYGTHAHSWVMSFPSEIEAFRAYGEVYPDSSILLIDTYGTLEQGLPHAIQEAKRLEASGHRLLGVRLDSGDLVALSKACRAALDEAGLGYVKIIASGDLDEYSLDDLRVQGAPIDIYGVGTRLSTAFGEPALGGVYKLVALKTAAGGWEGKMKLASHPGKMTIPGRKQIWRTRADRFYAGDILALADEGPPSRVRGVVGDLVPMRWDPASLRALLEPRIRAGRLVAQARPLARIREDACEELDRLDPQQLRISDPVPYPIHLSESLWELFRSQRGVVSGE